MSVSEQYLFELRIYDRTDLKFVIEVCKRSVRIVKGENFEFGKLL